MCSHVNRFPDGAMKLNLCTRRKKNPHEAGDLSDADKIPNTFKLILVILRSVPYDATMSGKLL